jgi:two-component system, NarL family, nitrate/nitrite response regulator NarL
MQSHSGVVTPTRSGSILIVDADQAARAAMGEALGRLGRPIVETDSAEDALRAAEADRPSVAISEVVLPTISGYELCRALKDRYGADFPVVFISGQRTAAVDRVAGLLIGADDYLVKPVHPDELLVRVRRLIRHAEPAGYRGGLTPREREVLELLIDGLHQVEIAERLVITPRTVAKHVEHILAKLGVHTRAQAVAVALRAELSHGVSEPSRLGD